MMKRLLAALMLMQLVFAGFAAPLTATLQSGDVFTPFYGENSFVEAYNAAADGDIITLSPGVFKPIEIKKPVIVIGAGAFGDDNSKISAFENLTVSGDNVTLEGIRITGTLTIKAANNLTLQSCYIHIPYEETNEGKKYHDNTVMSDCMVDICRSMLYSKNAVFRNCCINRFETTNEPQYPALIENCNIPWFIVRIPYAIYRNCFLGLYKSDTTSENPYLSLDAPSEFHNVIFYSSYKYPTSNAYYTKPWNFNFTSCIVENIITIQAGKYNVSSANDLPRWSSFEPFIYEGMRGGPVNVKEYPSIPAITSAEIDTATDDEGRLHVKISATMRD